jgi:hypothetical protein
MMIAAIKHTAIREAKVWLVIIPLILAYVGWDRYWTPDHWYRWGSVFVEDGEYGDDLNIIVKRTILQDFDGHYSIAVRRQPYSIPICTGSVPDLPYTKDAVLPDKVKFSWWTYGAKPDCKLNMISGLYRLETCVSIKPHIFLLGERRTCKKSNYFIVR